MKIDKIVEKSIDLHVHVGPEIIPRKYNPYTLAKSQIEKVKKICIKSHCFSTVSWSKIINSIIGKDFLIGSITLNNFVGGMNKDALYAAAKISDNPFIVWFPTVHAENFLKKSKEEFRKEWVNDSNFIPRRTKEIKPVKILENGRLRKDVREVLVMIKDFDCVLATGHISWKESKKVVEEALGIGIKKIIITHPIYQPIEMPFEIQAELASKGAFIEQCYSMNSIDKIPYERIVGQINSVGANKCILSSDVGQQFSLDPDKAIKEFIKNLSGFGLSNNELYSMLVKNPLKLIK